MFFEGFGGAVSDQRSDSGGGPAFLPLTVVKILQKKGTDERTDKILAESPKFGTPPNPTDPARCALLPKIFWFWNF